MITKELELELKRKIFDRSYYLFFRWAFEILFPNEKYEDAFHIEFLCDLYQQEIERIIRKEEKGQDLLVNIPPRTSKSLITSVMLNAWAWTKDATLPFITVSFDEELTLLNARYCKDLIKSEKFQELYGDRFQIRKDVDTQSFFMTDKGGFRMSKTTGANITGHKGVVIIVDDPQNPKTAESEVNRKTTIEYYTRSLYNRLTPINLGIRIIIMQRLHEDDLTGYLLKNNPNDYLHICLPAEVSNKVNPKHLLQKYINGLLDPVRLSTIILKGFKGTLGTRGYSGQYEQTPSPDEGGVIKKEWFDIYKPEMIIRDTSNPIHFILDSAYTDKTKNDPSGILTCFVQDNYLYVLDFQEWWLEFPELCSKIVVHCNGYHYTYSSKVLVEPKASGKSIVQQLRSSSQLNMIESKSPQGDKLTRTVSITPILESRKVRLIEGPYVNNFLELLGSFPNGSHDESVDVLYIAVSELLINDSPDFFFV